MAVWLILAAGAAYMALLFAIAHRGDRAATAPGFAEHPAIYALALGVYCTSWTYFGAVGAAAQAGWEYLPIYLGPAIVFLLAPGLIRRIAEVSKREGVTSLSDFLSARYGKSRAVAALATIVSVAGSLPYIALQLKAVGQSFEALASGGAAEPAQDTVLVTALALAAFAILFGARQSDATRHNTGVMRVLAFEAVVKLAALVAVCGLALVMLPAGEARPPAAEAAFAGEGLSGRFVAITLLSMAAIVCLPRQFHVAFIERRTDRELSFARFAFPAYLAATSAVVIPITLAGLSVLGPGAPGDLYVLQLPLLAGQELLALFVFLGGFSAASGMVIVATLALSTMLTHDLIVPGLMRSGRFASFAGAGGARLISIRRGAIIAVVLLAYGYYLAAADGAALAQIGLISFAGAAQFAPALVAGVYWTGAKRAGVLAGLGAGALLWAYTLFLPAAFGVEAIAAAAPTLLHPHRLLGVGFDDPLTHGVVWSLGVNLALLIAVSLRAGEALRDRVQAAAFVDTRTPAPTRRGTAGAGISPDALKALATRFLTPQAVEGAFARFAAETGVRADGDAPADWTLVQRSERLLASALGASSARVVMASALGGGEVGLADVLTILDHKAQAARFDRHMLQAMLENISHGISVVDSEQRLVAWNAAYVALFAYPPELVCVGQPVARLIEANIRAGWISGDPAEEARRRIAHMRAGKPHVYERRIPNGRYLRITGNPMPGGGYVSTFADITEDKEREAALVEAKHQLEDRVRARTRELEAMAEDLLAARQAADGANASKTRFLAAASHDLMQPLNAARLLLAAVKPDAGAQAELLAKADRAIQSADDLLKGLLDISRLDHGDLTAQPAALPLAPLLEDLADEAAPMAARAGLSLRVAPTRLCVFADPEFLKSILRNFISNARRYTQTGGVLIGARRRGRSVRIEVWDTGPGVPEALRERVFEEFQRFADTDNAGVRGAGLGLATARRLAALMGAEIGFSSRVGRGSVFFVTVPVDEAQGGRERARRPSMAASPAPALGLTVLCVDDEPAILEAMQALLARWGCAATLAADAEAALACLRAQRFDAVIADLRLKDEAGGLAVLAAAAARLAPGGGSALLTASLGAEAEAAAAALGARVLRKPADPLALWDFLAGVAMAQAEAGSSSAMAAL